MSAPSRIALDESGDGPLDPITALMPWVTPEEAGLRRRILKCRLTAARKAARAGGVAQQLCWAACDLAGQWDVAPASIEQLQDVIEALTRMFLAVGVVERLETTDA